MDRREGGLAAALEQIHGVDIDEAAVRAHVAFFLPQKMELVVLVNSPVGKGPTGQFLYTVVSETYIAHIEELTMLPAD